MAIKMVNHAHKSEEKQPVPAPAAPEKSAYKVTAKPVSADYLNGPGRLRVQHMMFLYGCSQSAVYRKIKDGHMPPPTGTDPRKYWSNEVVRKHLTTREMPSVKSGS
jgi:predicted DNA-binding transcriptional regulator AlpA